MSETSNLKQFPPTSETLESKQPNYCYIRHIRFSLYTLADNYSNIVRENDGNIIPFARNI